MSDNQYRMPGDLPDGSRLASYQIEELIGRGGMAVVYRAIDIRLDRAVALKVLTPELARDDAFRLRFIRESRAGAAVDHPNIIPVFEAGEADGLLFIAMRYVTGRDVGALIDREGSLAPDRVVSIVTQIAAALDAGHAHGLVHRDVKPANMLLASLASAGVPDHVYLSDFGLSKQSLSTSSLTGTGQFLGTLDYMAPEQIEGRPVDGRTDLYSLACAAFEMLCGEPPFRREQNMAVMWAQVSAPPPSVSVRRSGIPAAVDAVLAAAMAKSPADRPPSCQAFASALRAACDPAAAGSRAANGPAGHPGTELAHGVPAVPPGSGADPGQDLTATHAGGRVPAGPGVPGAASGYPSPPAGYQGAQRPGSNQGSQPAPPGFPGSGFQGAAPGYGGSGFQGEAQGYREPARQGPVPGFGAPGSRGGGYPGQGTYPAPAGPQAGQTGPVPPGWPPARPPKRKSKVPAILGGCAVVVVLAAAAVLVLHLRGTGSQPTPPPTTPASQAGSSSGGSPSTSASTPAPPPLTAEAVVQEYINDINAHDYQRAYQLNPSVHPNQTLAQFEAGFAKTAHDTLTIISHSGDMVLAKLTAMQTDGTTQVFQGTYTVQNGKIVKSAIASVS